MSVNKKNKAQVTEWQMFLNAKRGENLVADGIWGKNTEAATKRFQASYGLREDGIVGVNTYNEAAKLGFVGGGLTKPNTAGTFAKKKILVSAGHSNVPPRDPGATGNGYVEAVLAVELRDMVAERLRKFAIPGLTVIEDGDDGENHPLKKAIALAKTSNAAIELHWNANVNPKSTGIEVLSKPNKKTLAQEIAGAIQNATGLPLRGEKGWKIDTSGQHPRLGFCEAGGLIVEVCFISNPNDIARYVESKEMVAEAIALALSLNVK